MSLVTSVNTQPRSLASLPIPASGPAGNVPGAPPYWDISSSYAVGDKVSYSAAGIFRVATALVPIPAGFPPPPTLSWSSQISGEPLWDASATYFPGDIVSYSDDYFEAQLYMALSRSRGVAPTAGETSEEWKLMSAGAQSLVAGDGISIVRVAFDDVISTALVGGTGISVTPDLSGNEVIASTLTAGVGIDLSGSVVSSALVEGRGIDISGAVVSTLFPSGVIPVTIVNGANSGFNDISAGMVAPSASSKLVLTPLTPVVDPTIPQLCGAYVQWTGSVWRVFSTAPFSTTAPSGITIDYQWVQLA